MSKAIERTRAAKRLFLPVNLLDKHGKNPNVMGPKEFTLLVDNIERLGMTEPLLVREIEAGRYRIVGGHHRFEAALHLGFDEVPCTVVGPDVDDDMEQFQLVRMNVIHGKMSPQKFMELYESMSGKYEHDILREMFGFAEEEELQKLIAATKKALPKELQAQFSKAAKAVKTIEELAKVLNHILSSAGTDLKYGFAIFDFNGKESIWIRMPQKTLTSFYRLGEFCRANKRAMDDVIAYLVANAGTDGNMQADILAATQESNELLANHALPVVDPINLGPKS